MSNESQKHIIIYKGDEAKKCASTLGRDQDDNTYVQLGQACMRKGIVLHELNHAIGKSSSKYMYNVQLKVYIHACMLKWCLFHRPTSYPCQTRQGSLC